MTTKAICRLSWAIVLLAGLVLVAAIVPLVFTSGPGLTIRCG